jgi:hypothetical protein
LSLVETLASVAEEIFVIQECKTLFPGRNDGIYEKSNIMAQYFGFVDQAEKQIFGVPHFLPKNVSQLAMNRGDLNLIDLELLKPALNSDLYIVFSGSYLKGPLLDHLIANNAINIHIGVSPYYRGMSCNFWALYEGRPEYVGATIHFLSKGLDSGSILFHALPKTAAYNPFDLGMQAVKAAHQGLAEHIKDGTLLNLSAEDQNRDQQIRYAKGIDFTDKIAEDFLSTTPDPQFIENCLKNRNVDDFIQPFYY